LLVLMVLSALLPLSLLHFLLLGRLLHNVLLLLLMLL